jgi:hypothetical protein
MPKCINDTTKSYTGKEPSPKGIGYSASCEKVGKKMKGKDNNIWIVSQTKTCLKWIREKINSTKNEVNPDFTISSKVLQKFTELEEEEESRIPFQIDFDNLDRKFYETVYFPNTSKIETETGLEEKFGGNIPFFIEGEKWPEYNKISMVFFGQLRDPRKKDSILYRIFIASDNNIYQDEFHIDKIELNPENLGKQIKINKPKNNIDIDNENKEIELTTFLPYKINKWNKELELKSFDYIVNKINTPKVLINIDLDNELRTMYYDSKYAPSCSIKVGGTPAFTQLFDEKMINKYNFLQLSGAKILDYEWGDCGIAHITDDCDLYWDCS